jgi:TetR/AcrR family transcriptional regulator, transcriptional repressor for nem operon
MPRVSREQADRNRKIIEAAAVRLFNERGINGVSVAAIMASAGLTHGGFYGHFDSKYELAAIACSQAFEQSAARWRALVTDGAGEQTLVDTLAKHYLNAKQRDMPGLGCPAVGLAADVGREPEAKPVRQAYSNGLRVLVDILVSFSKSRQSKKVRQRALARMSILVGAVTLARAVRDDPLSDEILVAARAYLRTDLE